MATNQLSFPVRRALLGHTDRNQQMKSHQPVARRQSWCGAPHWSRWKMMLLTLLVMTGALVGQARADCLDLQNGFFINTMTWSTAPSTNTGVTTVTRTATSIVVQRAGQTGSVSRSGDYLYAVYGDRNYVALMRRQVSPAGTSITWSVSMVDTSGPAIGETFLFSQTLPSTHPFPSINRSQNNGQLTFFFSGTGTTNQVTNLMIVRSDDGTVLLNGPPTVSNLSTNVTAEITATELIINHQNSGTFDQTTGPRPAGSLTINPGAANFDQVVLGASDPTLATSTGSFTFTNSGTDCITVQNIADNPPFVLTPASRASLPIELEPGESSTITVEFAPTTTGNVTRLLTVERSPANGMDAFTCSGNARSAIPSISVSRSSINFGTLVHPSTDSESFNISNTGEIDLTVTIPPIPAGSDFTWSPVGTFALPVAGPPIQVAVIFTTPGDFAAPNQIITITATNGAASRSVSLSGAGCIPNAVPILPPSNPINFGDIERGFRTARFIEIQNNGDDELNFEARIVATTDPTHADLFGLVLPDNDITDAPPTRNYTVLPITRCGSGPTGSGTIPVTVSFHADADPAGSPYAAELEIDANGIVTTYALTATITPPVPVDAVLVFDHSGSMSDPAGARTKIEAARSAGSLFVQLLREDAGDRAAIIGFNELPIDAFPMDFVAGNKNDMFTALNFTPDGATNIAGGMILGAAEYDDPPHPDTPSDLKRAMVVLTDGMENVCFQVDGTGPWYSITGRDADMGMRRPDLTTPQNTQPLPIPTDHKVYGIALGNPADVDGDALDLISSATGGGFDQVADMTGKDFFLLEKYFTQVFMETASLSIISDPFYTIAPGDTHQHEFDIFPGDVSAMIVVYDHPTGRLPFYIESPRGEIFSGTELPPGFGVRYRSTPTARFVDITFPRGEPKRYATDAHNRWKVVVNHNYEVCVGDINQESWRDDQRKGQRENQQTQNPDQIRPGFLPLKCRPTKDPVQYGIAIAAGSNLGMQAFVEPGTKYIGDTIQLNATIAEAGLPVRNATVRVHIETPSGQATTLTLHDDGTHQDGQADDGDYANQFTKTTQAGIYRFTIRAQGIQAGRPWVRELQRTKVIQDPRTPRTPTGDIDRDCCDQLLRLLNRNTIRRPAIRQE